MSRELHSSAPAVWGELVCGATSIMVEGITVLHYYLRIQHTSSCHGSGSLHQTFECKEGMVQLLVEQLPHDHQLHFSVLQGKVKSSEGALDVIKC